MTRRAATLLATLAVAVALAVATVAGAPSASAAPASAASAAQPGSRTGPPASTRAAAEPTLTVRGEGRARATPDSATIFVSVRRRARTAAAARAQADDRTRAVIAALVGTGLDRADLQTSTVGLRREAPRRGQAGRGRFVASASITVRTRRIDLVGALLAVATRAGADNVNGPNFTLADPSSAAVAATEAALTDARRRADAAANTLGMRVSGVRSVGLDPPAPEVTPQAGSSPDEDSDEGRRPPVEPGQAEVRVTVVVVFELD